MATHQKGMKNFDEHIKKAGTALGRLFARSQKKFEKSGRQALKTAGELVDTAVETAEKKVESTVEKIHEATATEKIPVTPVLKSIKNKPIAESVQIMAADITDYLVDNGKTPVTELVAAMEKKRRNPGMIFAAIGWLAGEGKAKVTKNGQNISSK